MRVKEYERSNTIHNDDVFIIDGSNGTKTIVPEQLVPYTFEAEAWAEGTMDGVPVPDWHRAHNHDAKTHANDAELFANSAISASANASLSEANARNYEQIASNAAANANEDASKAETAASNAIRSEMNASSSAANSRISEAKAFQYETSAYNSALKAEGHAIGEQNGVPVPSTSPYYENSAKYWAEYSRIYAEGGIHYKSSIYFADIPTSGMALGDMYDIKDDFTSDSRFSDGGGIDYDAGTNIIWNINNKWDIDIQGSGGGHTILNESGAEMSQRSKLQFEGAIVSDDVINDTTIVEIEDGFDSDIVAPTEVSPSAHAYDVGNQLIYDDKLYKATRNIAIGDELTISEGTAVPKTWNGLTSFIGEQVWTDGDNIYYSYDLDQYVLDKATSTWTSKTWNGLTSFRGYRVWTDGDNIYYSNGSDQYVLDKSTFTWNVKTWNGYTAIDGLRVWTDGENIYLSGSYVLDKATSTWNAKTWNGLPSGFDGNYVWTDGDNIYYSNYTKEYVLDKSTSTWNTKTWSGIASLYTFIGNHIWTDGENIYYSYNSAQYVLDKATSTWNPKTWNGLTSFDGTNIWTDGDNTYYSYDSVNYVFLFNNITLSDPIVEQIDDIETNQQELTENVQTLENQIGNTDFPNKLGATLTGIASNLNTNLVGSYNGSNIPFKFGIDSSGNYGYIKAGADSVTPFKLGNITVTILDSSYGFWDVGPRSRTLGKDYDAVLFVGSGFNDGNNNCYCNISGGSPTLLTSFDDSHNYSGTTYYGHGRVYYWDKSKAKKGLTISISARWMVYYSLIGITVN